MFDVEIEIDDITYDATDIVFDYLLMLPDFGEEDPTVQEYQQKLQQSGVDTNPANYRKYTTVRGCFIHWEHLPSGKHI